MSTGKIVGIGVLIVVVLAIFSGVGSYNSLVEQDEQVVQAWANVETQYQRRADLIPNLVSTVRGAADFEQETLEAVTNARARATSITIDAADLNNPARMQEFMAAQETLGGALGRLLAVSENYPQLRATESFRDLQSQLEGTENRITVARRDYNGAVQTYNTRVRRFPTSIVAGITGFDRRTPFEAQPGSEKAPVVDFDS